MVFSSLPLYLDPPNWQQHQQGSGNYENPHLQPAAPPPQLPPQAGNGVGVSTTTTSIRPNSMAERARLAKIPQPEAPLKCPRCESTNTKFCYFNNYSLSQPRHFCKTCRRYWTRGGALRNVPVGGGCRRNSKRSKNSRSKSPINSTNSNDHQRHQRATGVCSNTELTTGGGGGHHDFLQQHPASQFSFMSSLQNLTQLGMGSLGLNLEGIQLPQVADFSLVNNNHHSGAAAAQHLPFLPAAGFEVPSASATAATLYPFQNASVAHEAATSSGLISSQVSSVKMEENQGLNINKQLVGMPENHQFWGVGGGGNAAMWTDLPGINTTSTSSHMM
ncbi:hypothetical protein Ancab_011651 [Ancistrocladus abbreviatus]